MASDSTERPVRYLDTITAYDLWSEVYDIDGNFLQALDTLEMQSLFPQLMSLVAAPPPWKIVDMGCGTGRNTLQLLSVPNAVVVGLDASPKMLQVARSKVAIRSNDWDQTSARAKEVRFEIHDLVADTVIPACALNADVLVSTLVLEHIPLSHYFQAICRIVKVSGLALVTNMHSEMGEISQAGFVDSKTGEKVRPQSYAHRLEDVIAEAEVHGLEVVGDILERRVNERMSEALGARSKKWIGVLVWFGMIFRRKT